MWSPNNYLSNKSNRIVLILHRSQVFKKWRQKINKWEFWTLFLPICKDFLMYYIPSVKNSHMFASPSPQSSYARLLICQERSIDQSTWYKPSQHGRQNLRSRWAALTCSSIQCCDPPWTFHSLLNLTSKAVFRNLFCSWANVSAACFTVPPRSSAWNVKYSLLSGFWRVLFLERQRWSTGGSTLTHMLSLTLAFLPISQVNKV